MAEDSQDVGSRQPSAPLPPSEANGYPFFAWAGLRVVHAGGGQSRVELDVAHHHRGGGGTEAINGGIVAYMFDATQGVAVRSVWDDEVVGQVTVSLNIQYRRMLTVDKRVVAKARVTSMGRTTVFTAGEVYDEAGQVAASCTGIFRLFRNTALKRE